MKPRMPQLDYMDEGLRVSINNQLYFLIKSIWDLPGTDVDASVGLLLSIEFWVDYLREHADEYPYQDYDFDDYNRDNFIRGIKEYVQERFWYEVYDLLEFFFKKRTYMDISSEIQKFNAALEEEVSGFRMLNELVVPFTGKIEIQSIEEASQLPKAYAGAESHIKKAVRLISDRENPDYSNSIKEAISAVESCGKVFVDGKNATLGDVLKEMRKKGEIHPQLIEAWDKLSSYTNAVPGVRHGLKESEQSVGFDEAKYMLVTCSAIVNYLCSKDAGKNSR